jgi:hypothetical protein
MTPLIDEAELNGDSEDNPFPAEIRPRVGRDAEGNLLK